MYIGRDKDGAVFGVSTVKQDWATEELPEDHADVVAFANRKPREIADKERVENALGITIDALKKLLS